MGVKSLGLEDAHYTHMMVALRFSNFECLHCRACTCHGAEMLLAECVGRMVKDDVPTSAHDLSPASLTSAGNAMAAALKSSSKVDKGGVQHVVNVVLTDDQYRVLMRESRLVDLSPGKWLVVKSGLGQV